MRYCWLCRASTGAMHFSQSSLCFSIFIVLFNLHCAFQSSLRFSIFIVLFNLHCAFQSSLCYPKSIPFIHSFFSLIPSLSPLSHSPPSYPLLSLPIILSLPISPYHSPLSPNPNIEGLSRWGRGGVTSPPKKK